MNDDFDTDYADDFDSEFESHEERPDSLESTASEVDRVADILMGGSGDGPQTKEKRTDFTTRNVDGDGKPTYERQKEEDYSFHNNRSAPDMQSAYGRISQYQDEAVTLQRQWKELQEMKSDLPPEQFAYQEQFLQGRAAATMIQQQQAQIEAMQDQQWLKDQEAAVRSKHRDIFDDPQKKDVYSKRAIKYLGDIGYSAEELRGIGAREYNAVMDMLKLQDDNQRLKVENAKFKQEHRNRQRSLGKATRDNQLGVKGTRSQNDQIDEVARILLNKH